MNPPHPVQIIALLGERAGAREREIAHHFDAKSNFTAEYPGCIKIWSPALKKSFIVRANYEIVG